MILVSIPMHSAGEHHILNFAANFAYLTEKPRNRFFRYASHSNRSANERSFNQTPNHLRAYRIVQSVHAKQYA